jgi:hypothetical protein
VRGKARSAAGEPGPFVVTDVGSEGELGEVGEEGLEILGLAGDRRREIRETMLRSRLPRSGGRGPISSGLATPRRAKISSGYGKRGGLAAVPIHWAMPEARDLEEGLRASWFGRARDLEQVSGCHPQLGL